MEETVDLREYFEIIKKNLKLIIIIAVICSLIGGIFGILSASKPDEQENTSRDFESTSRVIVSYDVNKLVERLNDLKDKQYVKDEIEKSINYNTAVLKTYSEMLNSNEIVKKVVNKLNLKDSISEIRNDIVVEPIEGGQIINISVRNKNPKLAAAIANEIPNIFKDENKELDIKLIDEAVESDVPAPELDENGKIIPEPEKQPVKTNNPVEKAIMSAVIGFVLGFMIALFIVFLKEFLDSKVRTIKDIEETIDIDILGVIQKDYR